MSDRVLPSGHGLTLTRAPDSTAVSSWRGYSRPMATWIIRPAVTADIDAVLSFWSAAGYAADPTLKRYVKML